MDEKRIVGRSIPLRDPFYASTLEVGQFSCFLQRIQEIGVFPIFRVSHFLAFLYFFPLLIFFLLSYHYTSSSTRNPNTPIIVCSICHECFPLP
ncbi:hypothetical protein BDM02DRAFT_1945321 [Thelephora ganbajun]|uniref:Uncharacterized protein n=1 Tax=Thelephora ganbajun TaxID=370292 RepID=A0ACB6ZHX9_THEGA|nr:hypothetical protein BDM02DRAFT_1945321 [Thelephora ganbajun]